MVFNQKHSNASLFQKTFLLKTFSNSKWILNNYYLLCNKNNSITKSSFQPCTSLFISTLQCGRPCEKAVPSRMWRAFIKHLPCVPKGGDTWILLCKNVAIWNTGGVFLSYRTDLCDLRSQLQKPHGPWCARVADRYNSDSHWTASISHLIYTQINQCCIFAMLVFKRVKGDTSNISMFQ